ncbi:MAG: hypothetical protein Q8L14_27730 [Myxococcales bacterium]|nr:hypothetical protein [Myxococcales bacterium]
MRLMSLVLVLVVAAPAFAQKDELFGSGKPVVYREETMDRRFAKSKVAKMLKEGSPEQGCVQLMGALFIALAEIGPNLHKRDENFLLDPNLQAAIQNQVTTPNFPAMAYLLSMVRRVLIDKRLPDEWFETAKAINTVVKIIDLGKLKWMNEGITFVDSSAFTIPLLKNRYFTEVVGANSAVTTDVAGSFRDAYLDRDVAWGGATLIDAGSNAPKKKKGKKYNPVEFGELLAVLEWLPPDPRKTQIDFYGDDSKKPPPPVRILAKLAPKQYTDLEKVFRGQRMLVRGRFWEMNRDVTQVEVRDAMLFEDRDWYGAMLADPNVIATCPAAINELTGIGPQQPGGFKH